MKIRLMCAGAMVLVLMVGTGAETPITAKNTQTQESVKTKAPVRSQNIEIY